MTIAQPLPVLKPTHPAARHEIDVELFTFIERYVTNLARWDVLLFFGEYPSAHHQAPEIAQYIGRAARAVQKELDDLVFLGVLRADWENGNLEYALAPSTATRRAVVRLARDFSPRN